MSWLDAILDRAHEAIAANPEKANRAIAKEIGVDEGTVRKARGNELRNDSAVEPRIGLDGRARRMPPELESTWVQTRRPSSDVDPGEVEIVFYSVADGVLTMCDENGRSTGESYHLKPDDNPQQIAGRLAWKALQKDHSEFNRPLRYPPLGIA